MTIKTTKNGNENTLFIIILFIFALDSFRQCTYCTVLYFFSMFFFN